MMFLNLIQVSQPLYNLIVGLVSIWLIKYLWLTIKRIRSLPPGPWGLPIVGYFPFIKQHNYLQFDELSRRYGKVFSMRMGQLDVVVVCDWDHLKDALANDALLARIKTLFIPGVLSHPSFTEMSGDPWREHRRLSLHVLRDVGFGKNQMERLISEEVDRFCLSVEKEPVQDLLKVLLPSVSNNISYLLFGHHFEPDDPDKITLDSVITKFSQNLKFLGIPSAFPWAVKPLIRLRRAKFDLINQLILTLDTAIQKEIDKHLQNDELIQMNDYILGFIDEAKKRKDQADTLMFNNDTLRRNLTTFFAAGTGTVTNALSWALVYLIAYPEYQEKIRKEIAEVIGFDRKPEYLDRNRMPLTLAFINEVHRLGSIIPANLLRRATRDTKIGNHSIPKDTIIVFNFWSVHMDPNLWDNPEEFNPSRFLSDDGSKVITPPYLVPFSGGRRACPGEGMAKVELFLYIVTMVQRFKIKPAPGSKVSLEPEFGLSRRPAHIPTLIFEKIKDSI